MTRSRRSWAATLAVMKHIVVHPIALVRVARVQAEAAPPRWPVR